MIINYIKAVENVDEILNEKKYKEKDKHNKVNKDVFDDFEKILEKEKNNLIKNKKEIEMRQLQGQKEFYENLKYNNVMKIR